MGLTNYLFGTNINKEFSRDSAEIAEFIINRTDLGIARGELRCDYLNKLNFQIVLPNVFHGMGALTAWAFREPLAYVGFTGVAEILRFSVYDYFKDKIPQKIQRMKKEAKKGNDYELDEIKFQDLTDT